MSCGCGPAPSCSAPVAASASCGIPPCGLSTNTTQPAKVNVPAPITPCGTQTVCGCTSGTIPHFPDGVSQLSGESSRITWNF